MSVFSKLDISWNSFEKMIQGLLLRMKRVNYNPELIVGVARGGIIPATVLSYRLKAPVMFTKPLVSIPAMVRHMLPKITATNSVLLVDDVSDTGMTLIGIKEFWPNVHTATLFLKPHSKFIPDFYIAGTSSWINFPWENGR